MATVQYVARRSLAPGHIIGTSYLLPLCIVQGGLRRSPRHLKRKQETLSGATEHLYYGTVIFWDVRLEPIRIDEAAIVREFLDSTADGQVFTFDPYGSLASAVLPLSVKREDDDSNEDPFMALGTGGPEDYVQVGFRVRQT